MKKDYHMHPRVIEGDERFDLFAAEAIKKGIERVCITDHMPLSISNASDRIPKGRVGEYCRRVRELSERYKGIIDIKCGIEIDFHPSVIGEIEEVLGDGEFDYILGSSHMHLFIKDFENYSYNGFAECALDLVVGCNLDAIANRCAAVMRCWKGGDAHSAHRFAKNGWV